MADKPKTYEDPRSFWHALPDDLRERLGTLLVWSIVLHLCADRLEEETQEVESPQSFLLRSVGNDAYDEMERLISGVLADMNVFVIAPEGGHPFSGGRLS